MLQDRKAHKEYYNVLQMKDIPRAKWQHYYILNGKLGENWSRNSFHSEAHNQQPTPNKTPNHISRSHVLPKQRICQDVFSFKIMMSFFVHLLVITESSFDITSIIFH